MSAKNKRPEKVPALDQQVRGQLHALSQALEETARQYVLRLQREIAELSAHLPVPRGRKPLSTEQLKKFERILKALSGLNIKPTKGRRKDLKRIDEMIGELETLLEEK